MAETFQQAGGTVSNAGLCSGDSPTTNVVRSRLELNGTPALPSTLRIAGPQLAPLYGYVMMSATNTPGQETWDAGDWVVRVQVENNGEPTVTLEDVFICRIDSSGASLGTVTNRTGLGLTLASNALRTVTFTNVGEVATAITNRIGIICSFANSTANSGVVGIGRDQLIDTPIVIGPANLNGTSA